MADEEDNATLGDFLNPPLGTILSQFDPEVRGLFAIAHELRQIRKTLGSE